MRRGVVFTFRQLTSGRGLAGLNSGPDSISPPLPPPPPPVRVVSYAQHLCLGSLSSPTPPPRPPAYRNIDLGGGGGGRRFAELCRKSTCVYIWMIVLSSGPSSRSQLTLLPDFPCQKFTVLLVRRSFLTKSKRGNYQPENL